MSETKNLDSDFCSTNKFYLHVMTCFLACLVTSRCNESIISEWALKAPQGRGAWALVDEIQNKSMKSKSVKPLVSGTLWPYEAMLTVLVFDVKVIKVSNKSPTQAFMCSLVHARLFIVCRMIKQRRSSRRHDVCVWEYEFHVLDCSGATDGSGIKGCNLI